MPRVYWVGDLLREAFGEEDMRFANAATGHELHLHKDDDAAKNVYRKAVYVINDAKPYQNTLERLVDVQREVMALTGNAKPYDGILVPLLIEEVALVRLRSHPFYLQRKVLRETLLDELGKRLEGVKKNARAVRGGESGRRGDAALARGDRAFKARHAGVGKC